MCVCVCVCVWSLWKEDTALFDRFTNKFILMDQLLGYPLPRFGSILNVFQYLERMQSELFSEMRAKKRKRKAKEREREMSQRKGEFVSE